MTTMNIITCLCLSMNVFAFLFGMNKIEDRGRRYFAAGLNFGVFLLNCFVLFARLEFLAIPAIVVMTAIGMFVYYRFNGV